ncbi:protein-glutamate O-methyltransferase CheR [Clostridium sp. PL3]|uniref:Protein-glutamate O-methyltransferase CheR n=1 Tax=Clostridium thailandense TaxID=2794346 RepID=A0A949TYT9_9CLOT|nr:protein-glutamate O-methyltransferase CheR [Clostridium thailandense]MBV7273373.1 protein-glutamate O-methyltransferase CheR [Clostridium thailandense]
MILLDELYEDYVKYVFKKTGLNYGVNKKYFVEKRIKNRMADLNIEDFKEYYNLIRFSEDESEFYKLVNDLTVNETYFFRDFPQFQNFAEEILPIIIKDKQKRGDYNLRIWSAACSTGEEPYTLAIILLEMLEEPEKWNIEIVASDINELVIEAAKVGIYDERAVREVPPEYLYKYFTKIEDKYLINLKLRKSVKFKKLNLFDFEEMELMTNYDFIFCRNVLIYFNNRSRKMVVDSFYNSLNSGGFIFLGHSESIGRISAAYKAQKIGSIIVYSKP